MRETEREVRTFASEKPVSQEQPVRALVKGFPDFLVCNDLFVEKNGKKLFGTPSGSSRVGGSNTTPTSSTTLSWLKRARGSAAFLEAIFAK